MEIEINKTYDYFDDGKIREVRRMPVTITEIIPFDKIDEETLSSWKEGVEECDWLYAKETDYFIKGLLKISELNKEPEKAYYRLNNGSIQYNNLSPNIYEFTSTLTNLKINEYNNN